MKDGFGGFEHKIEDEFKDGAGFGNEFDNDFGSRKRSEENVNSAKGFVQQSTNPPQKANEGVRQP